MDEATPHIHATVIPIVTGERRKAKEKKREEPVKKKYRKKNPNAPRLCCDDIMTRKNLELFQDTYAEAMSKYGLERGIRGSEARHISTQEFYRNAMAQQGNLQENIELLLQVEESKQQSVEQLKEKEQVALSDYKQASMLKEQKESELDKTQAELKEVKGQLKAEKFKSSAAEAGSALMDGISFALGTPKVKRQQKENDRLKTENQTLRQEITGLNQTINRTRQESDKAIEGLRTELNKIYDWLPDTSQLIKMGEYCKDIGFSNQQAKNLVNMRTVYHTGDLYSHEYRQRFKAENVTAQLERDTEDPKLFNLLINKIDIVYWFRQIYKEGMKRLGVDLDDIEKKQSLNRGRGIR